MMIDSVSRAAETPDEPLPYADLGVSKEEYERICTILGRRPTSSELAMYSVMWSEHCSYKSSKVHLRQFAQKAPKKEAAPAKQTAAAKAPAKTAAASKSAPAKKATKPAAKKAPAKKAAGSRRSA